MTRTSRIYYPDQMLAIGELLKGLKEAQDVFEPTFAPDGDGEHPLYIDTVEITIRHRDGYTVGRIAMDDYLFFELTEEDYGEKPKPVTP